MSRMPSRTFCCCIPVRVGVILLGLLGLIGGAGVAAIGIIKIKHAEGSKIAAILQVVVYIILSIVSIFGLVGAITKRLAFVRVYLAMLIIHLLGSMAIGIYAIFRNFRDAHKYIADCASGSEDPSVLSTCHNGAVLMKSVLIGVFIVAWLLETWACFIVVNYSKQLVEEEATQMIKDTESW